MNGPRFCKDRDFETNTCTGTVPAACSIEHSRVEPAPTAPAAAAPAAGGAVELLFELSKIAREKTKSLQSCG